jgi:urea transport system substrate-binding protein
MPENKKLGFIALCILTLVIVVTSCSRSTQESPIRIGVLFSSTGTMAVSEMPLVNAVTMAVDEINAEGGLLGRRVEMVIADGRSDPAVFAREAERLITQEKVSALFACWTSACRRAVKPVVERYDHLMFYPIQYEGLEQSPNIVYLGASPNQQILPGSRWAFDHLGRRVYLLGSDYFFPRAANRIIRDLAVASGAQVLGERYLPLGSTDFEAALEEIRRDKPDVILNTLNGDSNLAFFRMLHQSELSSLPVLSFSVAEGEVKAIGSAGYIPSHYAVWSYFQSLPDEANRRFVDRFKARFGKEQVTSDPVVSAYDSVRLWAGAVRDAESAAPQYVNRSILRQSVAGPSGVVALDSMTRHVWKWVRVGKVREDGQFELVEQSPTTVRPHPYPVYRSVTEWNRLVSMIEDEKGDGR